MLTSSRRGISYPNPDRSDSPDIPLHIKNLVDALEVDVFYAQGLLSARPVSTGGSPGIIGRLYFATDNSTLYWDYGTGWQSVNSIGAGSVSTTMLADDSVTAAKIATDAVGSSEIAANAVTGSEIADGSVTSAKIADGTIVAADIANDTITATQIAANGVGSSEIATDAVTATQIAAGAVGTSELADLGVTAAKIAPVVFNIVSGNYTPVLTDKWKIIRQDSGSASTITIPTNSVAFSDGEGFDIVQWGAGQITVAGAGGVTVVGTPGLKTAAQYASVSCTKMASNTWLVVGNLVP